MAAQLNGEAPPRRVAGMCLARLRAPESEAQTLQIWIKGRLFYGARVALNADTIHQGVQFGLSLEGDHRIAPSGRWQAGDGTLARSQAI